MYYVQKRLEISASHYLRLNYESKCSVLHGHNWIVNVYCRAAELDENGMVTDFTHIKRRVMDRLDHTAITAVVDSNPPPKTWPAGYASRFPTATAWTSRRAKATSQATP